jgi:hypothetical protein
LNAGFGAFAGLMVPARHQKWPRRVAAAFVGGWHFSSFAVLFRGSAQSAGCLPSGAHSRDPLSIAPAKPTLVPLEILHGALVLFGGRARLEGAKIATLAGFRIHLSGIEPIFARLQFAYHGMRASFSETRQR